MNFDVILYYYYYYIFIYLKRKQNISFHYTYQSKLPLPPLLPSQPTPIQSLERVRHIASGKIQGLPYYI